MTYEVKEEILNTVLNQILSEIQDDRLQIRLMLEDPTYNESEKGVAYAIHEKLHHLAVHQIAVRETYKLFDELRKSKIEEDA